MARYILGQVISQVMFQQHGLSLWGKYNYLIKIRCIILEEDHKYLYDLTKK